MGEIMNSQGSEMRCSGRSEHFLPHMRHPSRYTQDNCNPVKYHQLVNKRINICVTEVSNL